ncbi:hypothetical protein GCM10010191_48070 [Actinomadura vinacea]|uniref:Uncharacterized protein n=1 Tax=Actinomadura vinacea TaxID=115336 RepID=A0ABN3JFX6_9ACTN
MPPCRTGGGNGSYTFAASRDDDGPLPRVSPGPVSKWHQARARARYLAGGAMPEASLTGQIAKRCRARTKHGQGASR